MQTLTIVVVGGLALLFWFLSQRRVKRLQTYTDRFARAFCEAYDHVLPTTEVPDALRYDQTEGGALRVLPGERQPDQIRALFEKGVDDYIMERLRAMYALRDEAQALLTTVNLVGNKYNAVLNHCYDLANLFFSFVDDPAKLTTKEDLERFSSYLNRQKFLRNTTLASIVSEDCKAEIAVA